MIRRPRLDLVLLSGAVLDAVIADDMSSARELAGFAFPANFARDDEWVEARRKQVLADPTWAPWSLRAIVLRDEHCMVGSTSFHGPPGINSLGNSAAAEVGYTIFPEFRNRGYATETCRGMLEWARRMQSVRHFISSVEPSNGPSLRVLEKVGFAPLDLLIDGERIFELRLP